MRKIATEYQKTHAYVDGLKAKSFFSVGEIELKKLADRREVYFLGENGDGKSLLLMSLVVVRRMVKRYSTSKKRRRVVKLLHFLKRC